MIFGMGFYIQLNERGCKGSLKGSGVANHRQQTALLSSESTKCEKVELYARKACLIMWPDCYLRDDSFEAFKYGTLSSRYLILDSEEILTIFQKARLPDLDIVTKRSQLSFSEFFRNSQTKTTYSTLHTTKQKLSANHGLGFTPKSRLHVLFGPQYRLGSSYGFNFVRRQLHG